MKTLRRILIALVAPATILLSLNQLGGNPLSKGYDTAFSAAAESSPEPTLAITTDAGNLNCWVRLRVPATSPGFMAKLSTGAPLWVYKVKTEGSDQWIAIVADGQKVEEHFKWPAGSALQITSVDKSAASVALKDWQVFLSDKGYDSKERAGWRRKLLQLSLALLALAIIGGALEGYAKLKEETPYLTAQRCIEELIDTTAGANRDETKWMKAILTKVLIQGVPVASALEQIPLTALKRKALWFKTRYQFRSRLERLIVDLTTDLNYLHP